MGNGGFYRGPRIFLLMLATFGAPRSITHMDLSESEWNALVDELGPQLFRYFVGVFPRATAADQVQETLLRLVQKVRDGSFSPLAGSITAYAFGVARLVRLEAMRKESMHAEMAEGEELPANTHVPDHSDRAGHLRWAIRRLKPIEQEVLLRMIDGEHALEEIADQLELPLGTVKSHVHRAKESLRAILEVSHERG